jgi:hypothetical protein
VSPSGPAALPFFKDCITSSTSTAETFIWALWLWQTLYYTLGYTAMLHSSFLSPLYGCFLSINTEMCIICLSWYNNRLTSPKNQFVFGWECYIGNCLVLHWTIMFWNTLFILVIICHLLASFVEHCFCGLGCLHNYHALSRWDKSLCPHTRIVAFCRQWPAWFHWSSFNHCVVYTCMVPDIIVCRNTCLLRSLLPKFDVRFCLFRTDFCHVS